MYPNPKETPFCPTLLPSWRLLVSVSPSLARPLALLPPAQPSQSLQIPSVPCSLAQQEGRPCPLARHAEATHAYLIGAGVSAHPHVQPGCPPQPSHTAPAGGRVCTPLPIALLKPETWKPTSPCLLTQPPPTTQNPGVLSGCLLQPLDVFTSLHS